MSLDSQHLISNVRPPRVQITYDVEIGNAIEVKELPFVVGILADLSGDRDPNVQMPALAKRKFVDISRDNFNEVMAQIGPRIAMQVQNLLPASVLPANEPLEATLVFESLDDFDPVAIIKQISPMADLYTIRSQLYDLMIKLDGNQALEEYLQSIMGSSATLAQVQKEITQLTPAPVSSSPAAPTAKGAKTAPSAPKGPASGTSSSTTPKKS